MFNVQSDIHKMAFLYKYTLYDAGVFLYNILHLRDCCKNSANDKHKQRFLFNINVETPDPTEFKGEIKNFLSIML